MGRKRKGRKFRKGTTGKLLQFVEVFEDVVRGVRSPHELRVLLPKRKPKGAYVNSLGIAAMFHSSRMEARRAAMFSKEK